MNGEGYSEIMIGANIAEPSGNSRAGETYVVFGKKSGFEESLDLGKLDGSDGFVLEGIDEFDRSGYTVSTAGDVNGDGYSDILIGAYLADPSGNSGAGETYIVFGKSGDFRSNMDLSTLDGSTGVVLEGSATADRSGYSVSTAGDVNGDGYSDILIGAPWADPLGHSKAGETYLIYGRDFTGDSTVSGASADDPLLGTHSTDTHRSELLSDPCITSPEMEAAESNNRGDGSDLVGSTQGAAERDDDREGADI